MADNHTKEQRSYNMSRIRRKDTSPELKVRKYLFSKGLRYRVDDNRYPGRPDVVLPKYKTAIFINGCFWHHHDCKYFKWPKTNQDYWEAKIYGNLIRDEHNHSAMISAGWEVIVIWECELKKDTQEHTLEKTYERIISHQTDPVKEK